jgi:hypothetical protein
MSLTLVSTAKGSIRIRANAGKILAPKQIPKTARGVMRLAAGFRRCDSRAQVVSR